MESNFAALNAAGEIILHAEYDAWGCPKGDLLTDTNYAGLEAPNNFTGYTYDITLGLYFAQSRFYDADDHRFISEDAAKDGSNWYIYCIDNPVMYVDANGLFTKDTKLSHATRTTNSKTDVKLLQTVLNRYSAELKFTPLAIDGSFGSLTEAAVNLYKDKYLSDGNTGSNRGVVGYTTWTKLGLPVESTNPKPVSTKPVVVKPIATGGKKGTSAKDVWQWDKMETKFVGESDSKNIYVALLQFWLNELGCMNRNENESDKSNGIYGSQTKNGLANFDFVNNSWQPLLKRT